ncbi:MAG: AAC(3) family N-acetyltransferase [Planctomycetes bacterium]|nr:AAC(3) family N-acetyltransferase [Planctomycetota bacterium]
MITKEDLKRDILVLGLGPGDHVVVHTSLSKVGRIDGGPEALLQAFLDVLGPEGTILVPTFTYSFSGRPGTAPFDRWHTPGSRTGIFTEAVRTHPNAHRSAHPTHSVAAVGGRAKEFTEGHESVSALGIGSPMYKAAEAGGYILLVGVTHNRNSSIHVGEVLANAPYLREHFCEAWKRTARVVREDGRIEEIPLHPEVPGCSAGFDIIDVPLRKRGVIKDGRIGNADAMLMKGLEMFAVVREVLEKHPAFLLCDNVGCDVCTRRKTVTGAAVARKQMRRS